MPTKEIDKSREPESVRLFESDFLEFFTHINPIVIIVTWVPVVLILLLLAWQAAPAEGFPWYIVAAVLLGIFAWTFAEYILHRYVFHYEPTNPQMERIFYLFHGVHHYQPQDKTRLVMPLPVSVPLALMFYGLFYLVLNVILGLPLWVNPLSAGFMVGYLAYDLTHYATHHFPMRSRYAKYIKRNHMRHHYKEPEARFGVSTTFWDVVFRTAGQSD